jgi:hypothetical protein
MGGRWSVLPAGNWWQGLLLTSCLLLGCAAPAGGGEGGAGLRPPPRELTDAARAVLSEAYGRLPLSFEAVAQAGNQTHSKAKFFTRGPGYNLFLTPTEAVMGLRRRAVGKEASFGRLDSQVVDPSSSLAGSLSPVVSEPSRVLRVKLVGSNPAPLMTGLDELPGKRNYFIGNEATRWRVGVPNYGRVLYREVYPGIDVVFHGNQRQLEFDFVVAPSGDPGVITLEVSGDDGSLQGKHPPILQIDSHGDLVVRVSGGVMCLRKPVVYQSSGSRRTTDHEPQATDKRLIEGSYVLLGNNRIGFAVAAYDRTRPLIIDPVLSYSTYLGGSGFDYGTSIAVDSSGNAYVSGYTNSLDFPALSGAQGTPGGGTCANGLDTYPCFDAFVTKLNPTGSALVYSTYLGGSGEDYATGITVDASGNAYLTGYTDSSDFPTANPAQHVEGGGSCGVAPNTHPCRDAFVAKLDPTGATLVYSTYLGGSAEDYGQSIAADTAGNALVTGFTSSLDFPTTAGALQKAYGGAAHDAFVAKLSPTGGPLIYSTHLGGSGEDYGSKIRAGPSGEAFVTGYTNSLDFPTGGAFQAASGGGLCGSSLSAVPCFDAFVAKVNAQGSALDYSTYLGGSGGDSAYGLAVDDNGNAYVAGLTTSPDFPVTGGAFQTAGGTSVDAFVTKLDPTGASLAYSTYLGGLGSEAALDLAVDSAGNAHVAGYAYGDGFPLASPVQTRNAGYYDAFLVKLNAAGSALIFSTYLGGSGNEEAYAVAVDSRGNAYLAGGTFSADFPVTAAALQTVYGSGAFDAFVTKFENLASPVLGLSVTDLKFSAQGVDTISSSQSVTLSNAGDAPLSLAGLSVSGDFAQVNDCGQVVAPAGKCTLSVRFHPTELGPRTGALTIASDAAGSPHVVNLQGTGVAAPAVTLSPANLVFPDQDLATTSAVQTVRLSNPGQAWLTVAGLQVTGDFAESHTCGASLPVEGSCVIAVTFTPRAAGMSVGAITITDNAPGSPHVVSLTGTGLGPGVALSSPSITFGGQLVGTTSAAQTVTLTNAGNTPLSLTGLTISEDFAQTSTCGVSLEVGADCSISVVFTPTVGGRRTGALHILDDAADSPQAITLSGMGMDFSLSASPAGATIGAGQSATYALTVTPLGEFNQWVALACDGAPARATCIISPSSVIPDGARDAATTVTVTTTGSVQGPPDGGMPQQLAPGIWGGILWIGLSALLGFGMLVRPGAARRRVWVGLTAALLLAALWSACGGGAGPGTVSVPPGTPSGTYTLTVTGSAATLTHSTTVILKVN